MKVVQLDVDQAREPFPNVELDELKAHYPLCTAIYSVSILSATHTASTASNMSLMSFSRHTLKQLKFVLPGGLLTYYFDSYHVLLRILNGEAGKEGWSRCASHHCHTQTRCADRRLILRLSARLSLFSAAVTISSFLYVLVLPLVRGEQPNVSRVTYPPPPLGDDRRVIVCSINPGGSQASFRP